MSSKFLRSALFVSLSLVLAGTATAATPADTLVIARNTDDALTFDPHAAYEVSSGDIIRNLYRRLFTESVADGQKIAGDIAQSWKVLPDGSLSVKIRGGLFFASGNPVTADDVVFSLRRAVKLKKTPSYMLEGLGWKADNVDGFVRLGEDGDVLIGTPVRLAPGYLLSVLTTSVASVVDAKSVLAHAKDNDLGNAWLATRSEGSGPYQLVDWKPREVVILQASPHFKDKPARLVRIIVRHVPDPSAQRLLLESGDADVASNLTADQLPAVEKSASARVLYSPDATVYYLGLNQKNPDLAKPQVWEALRYLVDYDGIARNLLKGRVSVNQGLIGKGLPAALGEPKYRYDPPKAKAILSAAGYAGGLTIPLDAPTATPYFEIAQALQQSFAAGGVKLELRTADIKEVLTRYRSRKEDAVVFSFVPDFGDPHASVDFFLVNPDNGDGATKKSAAWRLNWQDAGLTKAVAEALVEKDEAVRLERYKAIQTKVRDASPLILSFQSIKAVGLRKNVEAYAVASPTEGVRLDDVRKQR